MSMNCADKDVRLALEFLHISAGCFLHYWGSPSAQQSSRPQYDLQISRISLTFHA